MEQPILTINKNNGQIYTYRKNWSNILSPDEWNRLWGHLKDNQKPMFDTLLQTGARIMEALNIQVKDFDFDKKILKINTVKQRTKYSNGCKREIKLSTRYCDNMKKYISKQKLKSKNYIFLNNAKLPWNYYFLPNKKKKKYYESIKVGYSAMFKRKLKKAGIDERKFSLHNIRKTSECWLCFLKVNYLIILKRYGHNESTALKHYVVNDISDEQYKYKARILLGDLYI